MLFAGKRGKKKGGSLEELAAPAQGQGEGGWVTSTSALDGAMQASDSFSVAICPFSGTWQKQAEAKTDLSSTMSPNASHCVAQRSPALHYLHWHAPLKLYSHAVHIVVPFSLMTRQLAPLNNKWRM